MTFTEFMYTPYPIFVLIILGVIAIASYGSWEEKDRFFNPHKYNSKDTNDE